VLHAGDHIIHGGAVLGDDAEALGAVNDSLAEAFDEGDLVRIVREMERAFGGSAFSLGSLFHDEQVRFAETIAFSAISSAEMTYKRLYGEHQPLVRFLAGLALPVPRALRLPAEFVVNRAIEDELSQDAPSPQRLRKLYDTAHREGVALDEGHTYRLGGMLEKLAFQTLGDEHKHEKLESLIGAIDLVGRVAPSLQPHAAQLAVFRAFGGASGDDERAHELRKRAADALRVRLPSA